MKFTVYLILISLFIGCQNVATNSILESTLPDFRNISNSSNNTSEIFEVPNKLNKKGDFLNGYKKGIWTYEIEGEKKSIDWSAFEDERIKINYPANWKLNPIEREETIFFADVNSKNDFFILNSVKKKKFKLSLYKYLLEIIGEINSRPSENVVQYICTKLTFSERDAYYLRLDINEQDVLKNYFVFITEDLNNIYDNTLRLTEANNQFEKEIFGSVVYSLSVGDIKLFNGADTLISTETIDIEDFN